jgi:menaquinone-dependent protoporphyrinogen oxidase
MRVLVLYATKAGATRGIAERIGAKLEASGLEAEVRPVGAKLDLRSYDAFVIGSALYYFHWLRPARRFLRRNRAVLAAGPVWLFSSGPVGKEETDKQGRDLREAAGPKELPELEGLVHARGQRVFFGALEWQKLGRLQRLLTSFPAAREALPEGDFRDWDEIEAWAEEIARELGRPAR